MLSYIYTLPVGFGSHSFMVASGPRYWKLKRMGMAREEAVCLGGGLSSLETYLKYNDL